MTSQKKLFLFGLAGGLILAGLLMAVLPDRPGGAKAPAAVPSSALNAFDSWQTLSPNSGLFTVLFPAAPLTGSNVIPVSGTDLTLNQEIFSAEDAKGNVYFVSTLIYPEAFDPAKTEEILRAALDGMKQAAPENQILDSQMSEFKGWPSLEFVMQDSQRFFHQGKLFFTDRILYQIFVTYTENNLEDQEYLHFLSSFKS